MRSSSSVSYRHFLRLAAAGAAAALLPAITSSTKNEQPARKPDENIGVYLKPESKKLLSDYLSKRGINSRDPTHVCVVRNATSDEAFVYKPLFGQRAAFRVKGIIDGDTKGTAVTGRVSTMVGELREENYEPCVPVLSSSNQPNEQAEKEVSDLPTRRVRVPGMKHDSVWKGRLPSDTVRGEKYPALKGVAFSPLPTEKQFVLEGYICSSRYVDENGNCLYDRAQDLDEMSHTPTVAKDSTKPAIPSPAPAPAPEEVIKSDDGDSSDAAPADSEADGKSECPVCRYMKAGPCKEEFLAWDACVQGANEDNLHIECFSATRTMMKCMQKHEYYDIMTAGTDFSRVDRPEGAAAEAVGAAHPGHNHAGQNSPGDSS